MASEMGVEFFEGEAYNANFTNNSGMDTLRLDSLNAIVKDKTLGQVDTKITAKTFINAAGAWSAKLVDTLTQKNSLWTFNCSSTS
jgi:glycerol-3-phosphate dehydrogenase